ncbi:chaplin family protein, partial [Streptomyces sp. NPDC054865]
MLPKRGGRPRPGAVRRAGAPLRQLRGEVRVMRVWKSAGLALAVGLAVMGGASAASADANAEGIAAGAPGVLSGNLIHGPVPVP